MMKGRQRTIGAPRLLLGAVALALVACGDDSEVTSSGSGGGGATSSTSSTSQSSSSTSSSTSPTSGAGGSDGGSSPTTTDGSGGDGAEGGAGGSGHGGEAAQGGGDGQGGSGGQSGSGGAGGGEPALPGGVFELDGVSVNLPYGDLAPIGAMIEGAEIVGLGETVHTSGGFYAAKNRLIRYLVETQGYRALAMETPRTLAEVGAAYVESCTGTSADAIGSIFSVFVDSSTQSMFEWLCQYNTTHPDDPVRFYGFDVQQPEDDRALLEAFLDAVAPDDSDALIDAVDASCLLQYVVLPIEDRERNACRDALDAIDDYVTDNEAAIVAARGAHQLEIDRLALLGLRTWEDLVYFYDSDLPQSYQVRDDAMAQVFETVRGASSDERTIVWAHDAHLRAHSDESTAFPVFHGFGASLYDVHGDAYRPFGITSLRTGINWPGYGCDDNAFPPRPGSLEQKIKSQLGGGSYIVDTTLATSGSPPWLAPGTPIPYGLDGSDVLERQFRGIVVLSASPGIDSPYWECVP